jgi:DNA (cytosine-5)-methyltransferase 1
MTKYSEVKKLLNIQIGKEINDQLAQLTHSLHNFRFSDKKKRLKSGRSVSISQECNSLWNEKNINYQDLLPIEWDIPYPPPAKPQFSFIDLFSGIGGFRIAFQELGGKCVFSSEIDLNAQKTYEANFGDVPFGDIRNFTGLEISDEELNKRIPDHDVLTAGFPCQPFSIAGVSKKNSLGRKHGFEDPTQGTLFFDIKRILSIKRPAAFFLENVKNLIHHDANRTFAIIKKCLEEELGYVINYQIVDAGKWVPQHRERIFIVGYNPEKLKIEQGKIEIPSKPEKDYHYKELNQIILPAVPTEYTLGPGTWDTLKRHKEHHAKEGNGFGYGIHHLPIPNGEVTRTISARYHKDGAEILIAQKGKRPRRLTVEEAMQLQGYNPAKYKFPVSNTQAYRQIGNSVAVPAIQATAASLVKFLKKQGYLKGSM